MALKRNHFDFNNSAFVLHRFRNLANVLIIHPFFIYPKAYHSLS